MVNASIKRRIKKLEEELERTELSAADKKALLGEAFAKRLLAKRLEEEATIPDHPIPKIIALANSLGGDDEELLMWVVEVLRNMQGELDQCHDAVSLWLCRAGWLEDKHPQIHKAMMRYGLTWRPK